MAVVESFLLDHTIVKAPYVRLAGTEQHEKGSILQKYDLRFLQPEPRRNAYFSCSYARTFACNVFA